MSNNNWKQWFKTNLLSLIGGELAVAKKQDREPNFDFLDSWIESNLPVEQEALKVLEVLYDAIVYAETEHNANHVITAQDKRLIESVLKEENNISQLQEVPPASVVSHPCTDGNSIEEKLKQLIEDLEPAKYTWPRMRTSDVIKMLQELQEIVKNKS